jgi:hypothetical protein
MRDRRMTEPDAVAAYDVLDVDLAVNFRPKPSTS